MINDMGTKENILNWHIIENLPKYTENDVCEITNMISTIERAHQGLVWLGFEKEIYNSKIVSIIEERMLENLKKEWIKLEPGKKD